MMKASLVSSVFSWDGGTGRSTHADRVAGGKIYCVGLDHRWVFTRLLPTHDSSGKRALEKVGRMYGTGSFSFVLSSSSSSSSSTSEESFLAVCIPGGGPRTRKSPWIPSHLPASKKRPLYDNGTPCAAPLRPPMRSGLHPSVRHSKHCGICTRKVFLCRNSAISRCLSSEDSNAYFVKPARRRGITSKRRGYRLVTRAMKKKPQLVIPDAIRVEPGKYTYDVENAINQLSALAPRASITRCMDSYRNKLSMKDFSLIFREFGQRGDWERAVRLFKYMQRQQWCKPHEHIYTILIGILGREGLLDRCNEIFEEMPSQGVDWNVYSFTALINAYGRNGQYEASLHLLSRMKRERVIPNLITYNTVINACAKGGMDWEGLLGLFAQMRHEGIQPDIITYNTLLGACSIRGLNEEAKMVFRTMNEAGVIPDQVTYTLLVETYGNMQRLDSVSELLREMEVAGNVPDAIAYNVLLEAFAKEGDITKAAGVFKQMIQAGCSPNVHTYSTLLECYGKHGRFDDVRELFTEMKASGTAPDIITYNTLIQTFGKGGYFKEVVSLFDAMIDGTVEPDMETYTGLLHACGMAGLHQEAARVYQHLMKRGLTPEPEVFNGLIHAYGKAALYQEADIAFKSTIELECKVNETTFNSLIHVYAKGGLYKEAAATLSSMEKAGCSMTVDTYNSFMEAFGKAGLFHVAKQVFFDLQEAGYPPDLETYETLLNVYCTAGLFDEAKAQFLEMKEVGPTPQVTSYCLMLSISARRSRWDDFRKLLEEMQGNNMPSLHVLVAGLIQGNFDETSNWCEIVEPAFDMIKVNGIESNMMFYNALLEVLWWSGQRSRAGRVLQDGRKRGVFPEAFNKTPTMWSIDVHRMSVGAALTTVVVWLEEMQVEAKVAEEMPKLFSIITRRTEENEEEEPEAPVSKLVYATLEGMAAPFKFAPWNQGRILSFKGLLIPWLQEESIPEDFFIDVPLPISNSSFNSTGSSSLFEGNANRSKQLTAF